MTYHRRMSVALGCGNAWQVVCTCGHAMEPQAVCRAVMANEKKSSHPCLAYGMDASRGLLRRHRHDTTRLSHALRKARHARQTVCAPVARCASAAIWWYAAARHASVCSMRRRRAPRRALCGVFSRRVLSVGDRTRAYGSALPCVATRRYAFLRRRGVRRRVICYVIHGF